jgi:hypothetical protein
VLSPPPFGIKSLVLSRRGPGNRNLAAQDVKKWESTNLDHKGFYKTKAKKTNESMMNLLTDDKPILSLVIRKPPYQIVSHTITKWHSVQYKCLGAHGVFKTVSFALRLSTKCTKRPLPGRRSNLKAELIKN